MPTSTGYTVPIKIDPRQAVRGGRVVNKQLTKIGQKSTVVQSIIRSLVVSFTGLTGTIAFAIAIRKIAAFEEAMAKVRAVTGATAKEFASLEKLTRRLGATTVFTANQASTAALFLGRAGFTTTEIQESLTKTLLLARAGGLELEQAADVTANTLRGFNLTASETGRIVDVLAVASASANTTILELGEGIKFVAPVAASLGVEFEEVIALLGKLSDAGLKGSLGGTGLRRILSGLANPNNTAKKLFNELGLDFADLSLDTNSVVDIIERLADAGVDAGKAFQLFGLRGAPAFLVIKNGVQSVKQLNEELLLSQGAATEMAGIMDNTLAASIKGLTSAVSETVLGFGDRGLNSSMRSVIDTTIGVISVWNGMSVEFARSRDLTVEASDNLDHLSNIAEITAASIAAVTLGFVTIGPGLKVIVSFGRLLKLITPLGFAFTAVIGIAGAFFSQFESGADRFKDSVDDLENQLARLRDTAGQRNFDAGAFGGLLSSQDLLIEKTRLQRTIIEYKGTLEAGFTDIAQIVDDGVDDIASKYQVISQNRPFQKGDTLQSLVKQQEDSVDAQLDRVRQLRDLSKQIVAALSDADLTNQDAINELTASVSDGQALAESIALASLDNLNDPDAIAKAKLAGLDYANSFLKAITEAVETNTTIRTATTTLFGLENLTQATPDVRRPALPGSFDALNELISKSGSAVTDDANIEAERKRFENFNGTLREYAAIKAGLETDIIFNTNLDALNSQIDKFREQIPLFAAQIADLDERAEFVEVETARADFAQGRVDSFPAAKAAFAGAKANDIYRESIDEVKTAFDDLQIVINPALAAQKQINDATRIYKQLGLSDEFTAVGGALDQLKEANRSILFPLQDLIDSEKEQGRLLSLNSELRLIEQAKIDANAIALASHSAEFIRQKALEIAYIRARNEIEAEYVPILESLGISLLSYQDSTRAIASQELFDAEKITEFENNFVQATERIKNGFEFESIGDSLIAGTNAALGELIINSKSTAEIIRDGLKSAYSGAADGLSSLISRTLVYGDNFKEGIKAIARSFAATIIKALIDIGIQMLIQATLGKALLTTSTLASVAQMTAIGAAAAVPAALVSLATSGGNAVPAAAGIAAVLAQTLAATAVSTGVTAAVSAPAAGFGLADGGYVSGAGGPRTDSIPALLSNGEFVVNAAATKQNRGLLESLNNSQRFANGGYVNDDDRPGRSDSGNQNKQLAVIDVTVQNQTREPIDVESRQDEINGRIILVVKEAFNSGDFDSDLESFGTARVPEQ